MKRKIIYALILVSLVSCRGAKELKLDTDYSREFNALHQQNEDLKEQLRQSESRQQTSLDNLQKQYSESERKRENESRTVREYDTEKPDNPVAREIIYNRHSESEKLISGSEIRDIVKQELETVFTEKETSYQNRIESLTAENSNLRQELKEKETGKGKLFISGFLTGLVTFGLLAVVYFGLKLKKKFS
jgi:predicted phage tail protein